MNHKPTPLPVRKALPHAIPAWVPDGSRYFITINMAERGGDLLMRDGRAQAMLQSIEVYEQLGKWWVYVMVVMPDHVHLIAAFGRDPGLRAVVASWKGYHAKHLAVAWQRNFFEHRLRDDVAFSEKMHYVRMNPVRRGLVHDARDWPHIFIRGKWPDGSWKRSAS
jgi:putative transposase